MDAKQAHLFGVAFAAFARMSEDVDVVNGFPTAEVAAPSPAPAPAQAPAPAPAPAITSAPAAPKAKKAAKGTDSEGRPTITSVRRRIVRELHGQGVAFKSLPESEQERIMQAVRAEVRGGNVATTKSPKGKKSGKKASAKPTTAAVDGNGNPATGNGKAVKMGTKAHPYTGKPAKATAHRIAKEQGRTVYYVDANGSLVKVLAPKGAGAKVAA